jgi:hypothetical protein
MLGLSRGRPVKAPILLALAGLSISTAQAAERAVVLACEGKVTQPPGPKPEPVSIGIIINFTAGTVTWADSSDFPLTITRLNEMTVDFRGSNGSRTLTGSIDRKTGDTDAISTLMGDSKTRRINLMNHYSLKCRPEQRMF